MRPSATQDEAADVPWPAVPDVLAAYPVRQALPGDGALYLDRPLPFLCVHRRTSDAAASRLVTGQAAYLVALPSKEARTFADALYRAISSPFDAGITVEVWSAPAPPATEPSTAGRPHFRLVAPKTPALAEMLGALEKALREVEVGGQAAQVEHVEEAAPAPPGLPPLFSEGDGAPLPLIGLEVGAVYRNAKTGAFFPALFEAVRRSLSEALKKAFYRLVCTRTSLRPAGPLALGPSRLSESTLDVDQRLARIDSAFKFLLQITPVNTEAAWETFQQSGFREEPAFRYRPLPIDPEKLKRTLFNVPVERVDDPSLAWLFREKQEELDRKITMLRDRGTRAFFFGSLGLFGEVEPDLLRLAEEVLAQLPEHDYDYGDARHYGASAFAEVAADEFAPYRNQLTGFPASAQIRDDLPPGLMVSQGRLLIGRRTRIPAPRVDALLQHEVGTHMVTYFNGQAQPLRLLAVGLAGYEALQEGLAVLAEFLVGGLQVPRLRVVAARVVAAHDLTEGATFCDVFGRLHEGHHFPPDTAFSVTMRTFRGGGIIKDVIYLRGLHELMGYLQRGGALEPLFAGKMALHHLPMFEELEARGLLQPQPLRPLYLDRPATPARLDRIRGGLTLVDLIAKRVEKA